jgi:hypothetical protein
MSANPCVVQLCPASDPMNRLNGGYASLTQASTVLNRIVTAAAKAKAAEARPSRTVSFMILDTLAQQRHFHAVIDHRSRAFDRHARNDDQQRDTQRHLPRHRVRVKLVRRDDR